MTWPSQGPDETRRIRKARRDGTARTTTRRVDMAWYCCSVAFERIVFMKRGMGGFTVGIILLSFLLFCIQNGCSLFVSKWMSQRQPARFLVRSIELKKIEHRRPPRSTHQRGNFFVSSLVRFVLIPT